MLKHSANILGFAFFLLLLNGCTDAPSDNEDVEAENGDIEDADNDNGGLEEDIGALEIEEGEEIHRFDSEEEVGSTFQASDDGSALFVGLEDRGYAMEDAYFKYVKDGEVLDLDDNEEYASHFSYLTPDGDYIKRLDFGTLYSFHGPEQNLETTELDEAHSDFHQRRNIARDGEVMLFSGEEDEYVIWDRESDDMQVIDQIEIEGEELRNESTDGALGGLSEDGTTLYAASADVGIIEYNLENDDTELIYEAPEDTSIINFQENKDYMRIIREGEDGDEHFAYDIQDDEEYQVEYTNLLENGQAWYNDHSDDKIYMIDFENDNEKTTLLDYAEDGNSDINLQSAVNVSYDGSTLYYVKREETEDDEKTKTKMY